MDVTEVFAAKVRARSAHDSQTPMLDRAVADELREHVLPQGGSRRRAASSTTPEAAS